ncbi:MAG: S41 family peptidase [Gammaproteobacteria bacterium]|nr:S41 family peptidase [Gammaproteobacteria bacterium]MCY4356801.1 S41 family peptidase [Gammaproteobacteria bacterium]
MSVPLPNEPRPLRTDLRTLLSILLTALASAAGLADESKPTLTSAQLDYYLVQSFHSPTARQRLPLNHIGIQGQQGTDGYVVSAVLEGYPAHSVGLTRGDVILSSDGETFHEVHSFNPSPQQMAIHQPRKQSFALKVRRGDQILSMKVMPVFENLFDSYRSASLSSLQQFSAGNKVIGYVRFWALSRATNDLFAYKDLLQSLAHTDGIVLDLRNSFGFVDQAHFRLFQSGAPQWQLFPTNNSLYGDQKYSAAMHIKPYRRPIVILINESTRSGAELLAYELGKSDRIETLGNKTAGYLGDFLPDSSIQQQVTDATITLYYHPAIQTRVDGLRFEGQGVQPELEINYPTGESRRDDPQFETALTVLLGII